MVASPPPPFVSRGFCRCCSVLRLFSLLLCSWLLAWRSSVVLAVCCPPPFRCARGALCCLVLPRCAALPSGVLRCRVAVFRPACRALVPRLAVLWAAARCAVFVGASVCVLCCAVGCCCVLCRVPGRAVRLGCSRCGLLSGFGLCCLVLCCAVSWVRCCASLVRVGQPSVVLLCAGLFCFARFVPLLVVPCPLALPVDLGSFALRRCVLQCSRALCALCCVCFVVACWCVLLFAAVLGAVCVLRFRAVRFLSSPLCAVPCCAVLVRLRCAVCVLRAVAGAWCCGALLCVVLFPLVVCGAVLRLVARGCLLLPCFGVGVPVWPTGLLPCGCCGLLWCPASLCPVLSYCRLVLCCCALPSFCGAVCACLALMWPVVRRRAVLCCAVGCLCCFLPGGGVCVLWCPFPPWWHAQKTLILTLCYPAPVSLSVDDIIEESGLVVRRIVADPGVKAHLLHFLVHLQQPGPHRLLVAALFGHLIAACSEKEADVSRVGHGWEEQVHGEQEGAKGSKCRGVAC